MIATQQQLIETFATLSPEAQRQALNFIAFLQQTYAPAISKPQKTEIDWTNDPFIGMWQERQDLNESTTWVRNIRNSEWSNYYLKPTGALKKTMANRAKLRRSKPNNKLNALKRLSNLDNQYEVFV